MTYIPFPLEFNEDTLLDQALQRLEDQFPGIVLREPDLALAICQEQVRLAGETARVAVLFAAEVFRTFGQKLLNLPAVDGAPARAFVTISASDDAGYFLPAGEPFGYRITGDEIWGFTTEDDVVIAPLTTQQVNVPVVATEVGEFANGIEIGAELEPLNASSWLEPAVLTTESDGGTDRETDEAYLNRLAKELQLMSPEPILSNDFAILAHRTPGVYRAVAIDGYNPADDTEDNERMVALAAVDETGDAVSAPVLAQMKADLEAMREATFVVNTLDPTFTEIDIDFEAQALAGYDIAAVEADAIQRVKDFIDPGKWGGGENDPPEWERDTVLRYLEVAAVIENTPGLDFITTTGGNFDLTINGARADVDLDGQAPLPAPIGVGAGESSVTGSVAGP